MRKYHLTPVKMTLIKKTRTSKFRKGCREKKILGHYRWECTQLQSLWKTLWKFPKKLKIGENKMAEE